MCRHTHPIHLLMSVASDLGTIFFLLKEQSLQNINLSFTHKKLVSFSTCTIDILCMLFIRRDFRRTETPASANGPATPSSKGKTPVNTAGGQGAVLLPVRELVHGSE